MVSLPHIHPICPNSRLLSSNFSGAVLASACPFPTLNESEVLDNYSVEVHLGVKMLRPSTTVI